jgi:hypothetical protein
MQQLMVLWFMFAKCQCQELPCVVAGQMLYGFTRWRCKQEQRLLLASFRWCGHHERNGSDMTRYSQEELQLQWELLRPTITKMARGIQILKVTKKVSEVLHEHFNKNTLKSSAQRSTRQELPCCVAGQILYGFTRRRLQIGAETC